MLMNPQSIWWPRLFTFVLSALAAASAVYWGLRWPVAQQVQVTAPVSGAATVLASETQAVARTLGVGPSVGVAVAVAGGRYALTGVLAERSGWGVALIATDGKTPKPYRVGARLDERLVLKSVATRQAVLATSLEAPASLTLEMPPLKK